LPFSRITIGARSTGEDCEIVLNSKVVLVVDPGTLRGVKRLSRQHGYDSLLFESAEAFQDHNEIDQALCVILDVNLNDQCGIEVRHRLKAAGISVPFISPPMTAMRFAWPPWNPSVSPIL
jgi:FixJ family two-component response regulator